ncbi:MAG TPA: flagellar motor protein MotB [Candidatus Omnitrophica bacterium]|nr:MAG: flagellar motor protein MotB [Candidatus Omnitrophota bacterium]RKY35672.1 MAG: flagellar motor protein MotB [Candidatus Omnitrophota bacterium]RKY44980.1 MAG: flagellar motor protein MotB [Candidatus Omnitrophota bacterium]HEC69806.1 flagellar motor protein MotB [Candidatus Omnitrophota bacterium]
MRYFKIFTLVSFSLLVITYLSGCALVVQKGRRSDLEKIKQLEQELAELRSAKTLLEERLSKEIRDKEVKLKMEERGLVITVLAEVLFDSGKAELRQESFPILDKVAKILKEELRNHNVGIEGHTDNQPIKYSGWKSNWELSTHRALSVLHYLEEKGINPSRLSAIGYGEYRPVASNDTPEGRQLNRRVEIVVLPRLVKKLEVEEPEAREEILK